MPGSPTMPTTCPWPASVDATSLSSSAISWCRPTNEARARYREAADTERGCRTKRIALRGRRAVPCRRGVLERIRRRAATCPCPARRRCRPLVPGRPASTRPASPAARSPGAGRRTRRAHDIAKRQIRNEAAERNASPFEDGGRFRAVEESSSEFVDEPRLAHARLADDADHLSLAGQRRRDQPLQQRDLLVPADERGERTISRSGRYGTRLPNETHRPSRTAGGSVPSRSPRANS